eukprot:9951630-Lingulodinium_polyedra.AAC.1
MTSKNGRGWAVKRISYPGRKAHRWSSKRRHKMENGSLSWQTVCHHSWTMPSRASGRSSIWQQRT